MNLPIILTNQRTGGTTLAEICSELCRVGALHEPFGLGTPLAKLRDRWAAGAWDEVEKETSDVASQRLVVKHCVEIWRTEANLMLLRVFRGFEYSTVFLVRKNATDRLLSWAWSDQTDGWLPRQTVKECQVTVDIPRMVELEKTCRDRLQTVFHWSFKPLVLYFEDLVQNGFMPKELTDYLDVEPIENPTIFLGGKMPWHDRYREITNYQEAVEAFAQFPPFELS